MKKIVSSRQAELKVPVELLAYYSITSRFTGGPDNEFVQCAFYLGNNEIVRFEVSPPSAVKPLLNLILVIS